MLTHRAAVAVMRCCVCSVFRDVEPLQTRVCWAGWRTGTWALLASWHRLIAQYETVPRVAAQSTAEARQAGWCTDAVCIGVRAYVGVCKFVLKSARCL